MRRGEHSPQAFQAPVDVHASADGKVYMFKRSTNESAVSSDDEEHNVLELRPYHNRVQNTDSQVQFLEREVRDDDNLNKLALQYGCKVKYFPPKNRLKTAGHKQRVPAGPYWSQSLFISDLFILSIENEKLSSKKTWFNISLHNQINGI